MNENVRFSGGGKNLKSYSFKPSPITRFAKFLLVSVEISRILRLRTNFSQAAGILLPAHLKVAESDSPKEDPVEIV